MRHSSTAFPSRIRNYFYVHRLVVLCLLVILVLWSVTGMYIWNRLEEQRTSNIALSEQELREMDTVIDRLEAEQEERSKLEEEKNREAAAVEEDEKTEKTPLGIIPSNNQSESIIQTTCNNASTHTNPNATDLMVNKKHCLIPLDFVPPDLVNSNGATISAKAANDFNQMMADAAAAGQPLIVSSSYRSYSTQVSTYNYWVSVNGQQGADTVSARPGYSEHQTGLAIDVGAGSCILDCFGSTSQYQWLQANAANYGFIQRYYSGYDSITGYVGEEWHYRYVGAATAQDMKVKGVKTLEQYWGMEGGSYR